MAVVTSDLLGAMTTNFRVLFGEAFIGLQPTLLRDQLATVIQSETAQETYNWLGGLPQMREWLGDRQVSALSGYTYTIPNRHWEATLEVDRDAIEDDRLGQIRPRINGLAAQAVRHMNRLTIEALPAGAAALAYDGQFFFDTDHVDEASGTQSNKLTGTGVTLAQVTADYEAAVKAMAGFKDSKGEPLGVVPTHVLAPVGLRGVFNQLLKAELVISGGVTATNIWNGTSDLIISPFLSDQTDWYLLALNESIRPLIFQMRRDVEFQALDNPNDEQAFMRRLFYYGVDARYAVGYGLWQLGVLTTNT